jgi:Putative polyhydroxyalkanoic acid system protein (PHA_gran_rgn)
MSKALVVSIPHQLGQQEAARRIKAGLATVRARHSTFFAIDSETWTGERLAFQIRSLGQSAPGVIDVADDHVRLEITLPWLLAKIALRFTGAIRKEGTVMLEKK